MDRQRHEEAPPAVNDEGDGSGSGSRTIIRSQDLVSLPVLRALLRERNVTRAGETIGLTQSATSNALARLRRRFGDELLVRVGRRYELTPLAQGLLDRADQAFDALERVFEDPFDPATSTREFALALSDYSLTVLSGALVPILRAEAPGIRLNLEQLSLRGAGDFEELLRHSDGVVLPPDYIRGHPRMRLFQDRWICLVGTEAPVGDTVTTDDLAHLPWVSPFGPSLRSSAPPVRQLRALGIEPRIEVSVDSFHSAPHLVAGTDRIAFIPGMLARYLDDFPGLRVLSSPLARNEHLLSLYWDASETNDPGHRWFRGVLQRAAAQVMKEQQPTE
ncbi:LysR family transcriptional regulator [Streptomyces himalayensis]|uniref:LysR family transcriptional regulator n=1 Tax=Streptomyces himalayensis subsp. himalayensis TaxID=2756131 RepID=A0A7W0DKP5_9ACTN|nr:LysR family transcriptional regulator [Streptomyces himalayensis]MBA2946846.1 LysR family transcriptional regulator [Streptomyces himalayensis subsp. himalayensis]